MDRDAFLLAINKISRDERFKHGVGTLSEKSLHACLKLYYCPNIDMHEVPIENYIADIYNGDEIIEIQTANMGKLKDKLEVFLKDYRVIVVHPIIRKNVLITVSKDTGEILAQRKSPITGSIYDGLIDLYPLQKYLKNENLEIRFPIIDAKEYRIKDARINKRGRKANVKGDRIPTDIIDEVIIERFEDYKMFIPGELSKFDSKEYANSLKISRSYATYLLNFFYKTGIVERVGKRGNAYLYEVCD